MNLILRSQVLSKALLLVVDRHKLTVSKAHYYIRSIAEILSTPICSNRGWNIGLGGKTYYKTQNHDNASLVTCEIFVELEHLGICLDTVGPVIKRIEKSRI